MPANQAISSHSHGTCLSRRLLWLRALGIAACVALAACGGGLVPVHNIHNAPILAARGQTPNVQNVRDAVLRALLSRGWQVDREGPDGVVATTVSRGNSATVLVQYDARAYSISYLDSSPGLKFNGSSIHHRYNEWIEKLDKSIRKLLEDEEHYPLQAGAPLPPPTAAEPAPATTPPPGAAGPMPPPPPGAADEVPPPPPPAMGAPDVAPHAAPPPPPPAPRK